MDLTATKLDEVKYIRHAKAGYLAKGESKNRRVYIKCNGFTSSARVKIIEGMLTKQWIILQSDGMFRPTELGLQVLDAFDARHNTVTVRKIESS